NLVSIHSKYKTAIPTIKYLGKLIGVSLLTFCKWKRTYLKSQDETPYTHVGREMYKKRTSRRPLAIRADELLTVSLSEIIARGLTDRMYNFEYYLNRPYAFNRDKGMCKVCGEMLWADNV